jgi:tRNA (guanine-N7-)-methyltransferase
MRKKLIKYSENEHIPWLIQRGKTDFGLMGGRWSKDFFGNDKSIVLEVGCGNGDYTVGLARIFSDKNFLGTDFKGDRLNIGAKIRGEENLLNVGFLRLRLEEAPDHFAEGEIDEIWITFPGPRPKKSESNRRLTNQRFLGIYKYLLGGKGRVHVKTDSSFVFNYTKQMIAERADIRIIAETEDLYHSKYLEWHHGLTTEFERKFLKMGLPIRYICFEFIDEL